MSTMMTTKKMTMWMILPFSLLSGCSAFTVAPASVAKVTKTTAIQATEDGAADSSPEFLKDRRDAFKAAGIIIASSSSSFGMFPGLAFGDESSSTMGSSPDRPIVVIGAGGKVGKICTKILNEKNLYTRAVTRSGRKILDDGDDSKFISYASGDVTNYDQLKDALRGASGVIFAASASGKKKGGEPSQVDYFGVYNTAKAAIELGIPKLVVVSAGTVTRPDSVGFKATNFFVKYVYGDRIMDYKIAGEAVLRDLYSDAKGVAYTVVRPGGLSDEPSVGSSKVHISQGDIYSSEISREDVALVSVAALLDKNADNTTFELNQVKGLGKAMGSLPDAPPALIHTGADSYEGLLQGLLTDDQMKSKYGELLSDFRGNGIEPIDKFVGKKTS